MKLLTWRPPRHSEAVAPGPRHRGRLNVERLEDRTCPALTLTGPTTLHAGDRVQIDAALTTTDPNENGEGESLQVFFNGSAVITDSSYNTTSSFTFLATEDGTLTAAFQGEDADEDGTVTVTPTTRQGQRFNDQEKKEFNELADDWNLESSRDWRTSIAVGFTGVLTGAAAAISAAPTFGAGAAFFTGATVDLGAAAALYAAKATYDSDKAIAYGRLARDPFDPNFTTVAQPVVNQLFYLTQQPEVAPFVPTFQALLNNDALEVGLLGALATAADRANSALQSGDPASEALQQHAIAAFEEQLAGVLSAEPALLAAAQGAVRSLAGSTDLTATPADVQAFESGLQQNGLPQISQQVLGLAGNTAADIQAITNVLFVQDTNAAAGDPVALMTDPTLLAQLESLTPLLRGGVAKPFATGADAGGAPQVIVYNPDGTVRSNFAAFDPGFTGGVRVAVADVNGDGVPDLIVGTGPGAPTRVRVFSGADQSVLFDIQPFEATFTGGVYVAAGDLTGDGIADLVITPDQGGGPRVLVYRGGDFALVANFFGIDDPNFRGGARAAVGDINGDGTPDLVVAAGFGGGPRVAVFDGRTVTAGPPAKLVNDFFVFEQTLRNGVFVAAGDLNGDGFADVIVGGGPGGGPRVFALSGKDLVAGTMTPLANFFAGDPNNRGGVRLAVKDLDGDSDADLVTGSGTGGGSRVTGYAGRSIPVSGTPPEFLSFDAFPGFAGGVFVG